MADGERLGSPLGPLLGLALGSRDTALESSKLGATLHATPTIRSSRSVENGTLVPVHLYRYRLYRACMEADFRATRLPLLDRGVVYVVAHVCGGMEMGRQWYEEPSGTKYLCNITWFSGWHF